MSLSRKLSRLTSAGPGASRAAAPIVSARVTTEPDVPDPEDARWSAFRSALSSKVSRERARRDETDATTTVPGETIETAHGPLHRVLRRYPLSHAHGRASVAVAHGVSGARLAQLGLDEALAEVDASRLVFLDTETTGLAGGTGTIPFLVGVGYFEADALVVEQWLLRRFGEEAPVLAALEARLASASGIVTYNGKSFDWPLLRTRYVLHRRPTPAVAAHVDLLHCARRLLRHRVASARLVELERAVLGHERLDDIDGAAIPEVFLALAKRGHHPDVPRVLDHNAMDLVAMPALLGVLATLIEGTAEGADAHDHLACARLLARAGDAHGVSRFAARAREDGEGAPVAHALMLAARHAREDVDARERLLEEALARADEELVRAHAHLALAKHLEHARKDFVRALTHARETALAEGEDASARRVARLAQRVASSSTSSSASRGSRSPRLRSE